MQAELNFLSAFQKAVRLTPLLDSPQDKKAIQDELDFIDALDTVTIFTEATRGMIGHQKYTKRAYDFRQEVKADLQEMFLIGRDEKESALKRRKNAVLYYYVLEPVVDLMKDLNHEEALANVGSIVERAKQTIATHTIQKSFDDALVMREVIRKELQK